MVIAKMGKPTVNVTESDSESQLEESEGSEYEEKSEDEQGFLEETRDLSTNNEEIAIITNEGWADSISKILGSSKPKNKKALVLSRAKKHSEVVKRTKEEKPPFEVVGDSKDIHENLKEEKTEITSTVTPVKKKKHEKPSIRIKPNILEKDRERLLAKIATKGVVQLFNAVRNQQKTLEKELDNDLTEAKKEKILKKFDKRAFLDTLMGQSKSVVVDDQTKAFKKEVKPEDDKPRWNALRDDFMMGAKMKDWDKEPMDDE